MITLSANFGSAKWSLVVIGLSVGLTAQLAATEEASCGRTNCIEPFGAEPAPFLATQRCSCSLRCSLFGDCCQDFLIVSKAFVRRSGLHSTAKSVDLTSVTCGMPGHLTSRSLQVRFSDSVPPFYHKRSCPSGVNREFMNVNHPQANNAFYKDWPVIDIQTGIVYDDIFIAECNHRQTSETGTARGTLKFWPSFEVSCENGSALDGKAKFNPFNPEDAQRLLSDFSCQVELTDPKNPVMVPISYCVPFVPARRASCVGELNSRCANGSVEIIAVYPSRSKKVPTLYRNADCANCSGIKDGNELNCSFDVTAGWKFQPSLMRGFGPRFFWEGTGLKTFGMMMDFTWSPDDMSNTWLLNEDTSTGNRRCVGSDMIYVPFLDRCRTMTVDGGSASFNPVFHSSNCAVETDLDTGQNYTVCYDAMQPADDDHHLHGEEEIPIRDIISRFITLGFMALSIISLAFLLAIYGLFPQLRNVPGLVIMFLATTLMVALIGYSIGVLALEKIWYPLCFVMAVIVHYCFLSSFAFSSCLAYDIWRTFANKAGAITQSQSQKLLFKYCMAGWLGPLMVVLLSIMLEFVPDMGRMSMPRPRYSMPVAIIHPADFHQSDYHEHAVWVCWMMNRNAIIAYFKAPIAVCLLGNLVFLTMTIVHIRRTSRDSIRAGQGRSIRLRRRLFIYLKLSIIMGMTWLFGFIAAATHIEALWIPFGLANSLQGVFICVSFVFTKKVGRLLRGWAANEHRRQSIDPRQYASTSSSQGMSTMLSVQSSNRDSS